MNANEAAIRKRTKSPRTKRCRVGGLFHQDGTFTDESIGVTYRGPDELGRTVEIMPRRFLTCIANCTPLRHRRYSCRRTRLAGNSPGPLALPQGTVPRQESGWMHPAVTYFD